MRTRFTVNESGELVRRDGAVLGRLVSITLDTPSPTTPPPTGEEKTTTTPVVPAFELELVPESPEPATAPVAEVWLAYAAAMKVRRFMDAGDVLTITAALKVATVDECKRAIQGCAASDWHMGRDPQTHGKAYKQLSQILKGKRGGRTAREQISFFIDIADAAGVVGEGLEPVDRAKLSRCKQAVMTAWEFPADDHAARAGEVAREWLADHGIVVVMSGVGDALGRPEFRSAT